MLGRDQLAGVVWFAGVTWKNLAMRAPKGSREALVLVEASFVDASALVADSSGWCHAGAADDIVWKSRSESPSR